MLGTTSGQLYETAVEEKDKKEKHVKLLFELTEAPEPFVGVQVNIFLVALERKRVSKWRVPI